MPKLSTLCVHEKLNFSNYRSGALPEAVSIMALNRHTIVKRKTNNTENFH